MLRDVKSSLVANSGQTPLKVIKVPVIPFENIHTGGVRSLHKAIFESMKLSRFVWQPCQQIESLDQPCVKFVYEDKGILGYASAYKLDATHFRLNVLVDPRHTRRGVGSLLLETIENAVRQKGGHHLQARLFAE